MVGPARKTLPAVAGTYVLVLGVVERRTVQVGRLGTLSLPRAYALYVGSALGPGGIAARVRRHIEGTGPRHWHVDHLRDVARVVEVWWAEGRRRECDWAAALARSASPAAAGFGASDCRCPTHLFLCASRPDAALLPDAAFTHRP